LSLGPISRGGNARFAPPADGHVWQEWILNTGLVLVFTCCSLLPVHPAVFEAFLKIVP